MPLHRRTNVSVGYVNFPINSKDYISTNEGGLFVELWAIPKNKKDHWMVCCGGCSITSKYTESLVGTDIRRNVNEFNSENIDSPQKFPIQEKLFPDIVYGNDERKYESIYLLACATLGSTGWSGYHKTKGMWRCTFNDLNDDGKELYKLFEKLYGDKSTLRLVTWLDT